MRPYAARSMTSRSRSLQDLSVAQPRRFRSAASPALPTIKPTFEILMASTPQQDPALEAVVAQKYRHGFVTDIEADTVPPGLDEGVIKLISRKKNEPDFMLQWRLKSFRHWLTMREPQWAHLRIVPIDYQAISYYSAPKSKA